MTRTKILPMLLLPVVVSGCLGPEWFSGSISNRTDQTHAVQLQVNFSKDRSAWTQLINETIDMTPNGYHSFEKIHQNNGHFEVQVKLENGTEKVGMTPTKGMEGFVIHLRPNEVELAFYLE